MKIGIDARLWSETGVGRYIRNLVWQLQILDKKNEYVLFVKKGIKNPELRIKANWKVVETDIRWHSIAEQYQFPKVLEHENLDLMHFPYFSVPILYHRPYVITIHDLIIDHYPTGKATTLPSPIYHLKLFAYTYVIRQAAHHARKVIAVSQATKDEIRDHVDVAEEKIVVTYEGVEDSGLSKSKNHPAGGEIKEKNFFLYVGNAYPHKNLDRLIDAFVQVVHEYPDYKLMLVGKEDYFYQKLKEKVSVLQVEKNIIFTGYVPDDILRTYYHHAVATIVPSLMEGFGLPGLEAMQSDCLVIASAIPALQEIYHDAAVYFDPLVIDSIHATILKVLERKVDSTLLKKKSEKLLTSFSWKKMAEETLKIYESSISIRSNQ